MTPSIASPLLLVRKMKSPTVTSPAATGTAPVKVTMPVSVSTLSMVSVMPVEVEASAPPPGWRTVRTAP